jgi:hypothetical protein
MPAKPMKLAEALLLRADMQTKLVRLQGRINANAVVQSGDKPQENPQGLLREATGVLSELESIVTRINQTNLRAKLADGRSLTAAIAERDRLKKHHSILLAANEAMRRTPERHGVREIKWVPQFDSAKLQKQAEDLAVKIRELNARIQETNWKTPLGE